MNVRNLISVPWVWVETKKVLASTHKYQKVTRRRLMRSTNPTQEDALLYMSNCKLTPTEKVVLLMLMLFEDGMTKQQLVDATKCSLIQTDRAVISLFNKRLLMKKHRVGESPVYLIDPYAIEKAVEFMRETPCPKIVAEIVDSL
jgi:hypothetical protein